MRQETITILKFDELSYEAKQTAIENYRNKDYELAWADENRQSMEEFSKIFPIKVTDWCYGIGGEGVTFRFEVDHDEVEELSGWRLAAKLWTNYKDDLFKGKYYSSSFRPHPVTKEHPAGITYTKRYSKIFLENSCVLTGYCMDDNILGPIYDFLDKPTNQTFRDLLEDCFHEWIKACNADIEWQNSDEYISGNLVLANEYEFTEDGETF